MKGQSKRASLAEALLNIAIGYTVALASNFIILPSYGMELSLSANLQIGLWYTVISLARSYGIRRLFNRFHVHTYLQEHLK